jgi:hypothetical protein
MLDRDNEPSIQRLFTIDFCQKEGRKIAKIFVLNQVNEFIAVFSGTAETVGCVYEFIKQGL